MDAVNRILVSSKSSSEALQRVFDFRKAIDPKFSIGHVCLRAGMPSRGNFSDVLKGKKKLSTKYMGKIGRAMRLNQMQSKYLRLLIEFDHAKAEGKRFLREKIADQKRLLSPNVVANSKTEPEQFLSFLVFATIKYFGGACSIKDIVRQLNEPKGRVETALEILVSWQLVEFDGNVTSIVNHQPPARVGDTEEADQIKVYVESMQLAEKMLRKWLPISDKTAILTSAMTVRWDEYREYIDEIRTKVLNMKEDLDRKDGDTVVLFNVQMGPLFSKKGIEKFS